MAKIDWSEAVLLEHRVAQIIREQEEYGVYFNIGKAKYYCTLLEQKKDELYSIIRPYLNYSIINEENRSKNGPYEFEYVKKIRLKNGEYTRSVTTWFPDDPTVVDGAFSRITIEEPSISKRDQVTKALLRSGWEPTEFTETGKPKLTEKGQPVDSLSQVGEFGKALADWYTYNHRKSQINGFFEHVRQDGRIAAQCQPCATNTFRAKHRVVANIPRPTSLFGKEMRSLFGVRDDRVFVGADLSGLELRMLAHHMGDREYIDQILNGDIHLYNLSKTGDYITPEIVDMENWRNEKERLAAERDTVKTWIYGFLYGSGDAKSGSIIGKGAKEGKALKETFFEGLPKLTSLINKVKKFAEKHGFLPSIDNRKIFIRRFEGKLLIHTALNAILQANGSIIAKRAMVIAYDEIRKRGLDAHQIIFYHDELAYDSHPSCAEEVGQILIDSMRLAGEYYNLNIPISGEFKLGKDWSVH